MKKIFLALVCFCLGFCSARAKAAVLYQEDWGTTNGGANATTLASVGWGQILAPGGATGIYQYGSPYDAGNNLPLPLNILYAGGNAGLGMFYTTNGAGPGSYGDTAFTSINTSLYSNLQFSVESQWSYQGQYMTCWLAVQVRGAWYVATNQPLTTTAHGGGNAFAAATTTYNPQATNWNVLTISPALVIGAQVTSNLSGSIDGIGIVTSASNPSYWNFNLLQITGSASKLLISAENGTTATLNWTANQFACLSSTTNLTSGSWTYIPNTAGHGQGSATVTLTNAQMYFRLFGGDTNFVKSGQITSVAALQQHGAVFSDTNGIVASEPLTLCKKYGWDVARIELFVNPPLASPYPRNAFAVSDLPYSIALAQRAKAQGMKVLLDILYTDPNLSTNGPHYADCPAAWSTQTYSQLLTTVSNYTVSVMNTFGASNATPEYVQVGNEIGAGLFWPVGGPIQFTNGVPGPATQWSQFLGLINAGIAGVRAVSPSQIMIHIPGGNWPGWCTNFFDAFTTGCANFDLIGLSYYPTSAGSTTTDLSDITATLNAMHDRYYPRRLWVVETSYMWNWGTTDPPPPQFPNTPDGQAAYATAVCNLVSSYSDGGGACWWGVFEVANDAFQYNWSSQALFDSTWYSPDGGTTWLVNSNHVMLPAFTRF